MSTKHSIAAARFIENRPQEKWHDETLWMVRAKRDKQSKSLQIAIWKLCCRNLKRMR